MKHTLIARIISGSIMDRDTQVGEFQQWQDYAYDESYNPITHVLDDHIHIFGSYYKYEDYQGTGEVVGFNTETNEFFIVSGGHCSCYGLEGQWDMEPYSFEQLINYFEKRIEGIDKDSYYFDNDELEYMQNILSIIKGDK